MSMLYDAKSKNRKNQKKRCRIYCEKRRQAGIKCSDKCENEETPILFGSNCFPANSYEEAAGSRYKKYFSDLFNYTTLPFFWQRYERERGKTDHERLEKLLQWWRSLVSEDKGHPIVWQKLAPEWLENSEDVENLL